MNKKTNILWYVADQMRCDSMAHMGNMASITPNLDTLAEEGVSFRNAYCQNPVCVPSRCSFLTGLYPHTTGHRTMHYLQREEEPNILKVMKENGYEVIWIGRNDVISGGKSKSDYCDMYFDGFDQIEKSQAENGNTTFPRFNISLEMPEIMKEKNQKYSFYLGKIVEEDRAHSFDWNCITSALDYLERRRKEPDAKPFFIYCTLIFPHPPYCCEEPWFSSIDRSKLPPRRPDVETLTNKASILTSIREKQCLKDWTEAQYDEMRAVYLAMTSRFDHQFGLLADKLKEKKLYDETSIFVFSDHGDYTGDYGIAEKCQNSFEDPLSNIPLLIKPAKQFLVKPGISNTLVELLDLPATVADMTGIELGYKQFGRSLVSVLAGEKIHKDAVFCEGGRLHEEIQAMEPEHGPDSIYWPRISSQHDEGPTHTKATMIRMGNMKYTMRLYEMDELYDLETDPMETCNVIDDNNYQEVLVQMKQRLLRYFLETSDYVPSKMDKR
ncbi:sulfatase-like hydrolase/transferase [Fusibacter ferrireducens]|uniref:Sulfatase-like hydrolase/transferase n=1 Tax=Fusibacter ferrireducens TaxID=2785058 RepID=A0ABR9ZY15_9FIRM|nr:sulfatase-like hydrolase/transferase [Fusibacter ferrireducens]MBF4694459.1 sulfatase-like hydrolase/transferase [Fusibacter ferrireducens]